MGRMSAEARARLAGEAELIRRHRKEFERLLKKHDRIPAIVALVDKYKIEYSQTVTTARSRFEAAASAA